MMTITTKKMTANTDMTRAFSQPQSKKCFTNASQTTNRIKEDNSQRNKVSKKRKGVNKASRSTRNKSKNVPISVPTTIIATASENFAFSLPASALPASHKTGDKMMMFTKT